MIYAAGRCRLCARRATGKRADETKPQNRGLISALMKWGGKKRRLIRPRQLECRPSSDTLLLLLWWCNSLGLAPCFVRESTFEEDSWRNLRWALSTTLTRSVLSFCSYVCKLGCETRGAAWRLAERTAGKGANSERSRRHLRALIAKKRDSAFCTRCTSKRSLHFAIWYSFISK